ncbi:MAG: hypothetical protein ABSG64_00895 [Solirubrobacteraceae bacterium]|jgi:hypothetical protein
MALILVGAALVLSGCSLSSSSGTPTYSGSGNKAIGTIKVRVLSTLRWKCAGCANGTFEIKNNLRQVPIGVLGFDEPSGITVVDRGTYTGVAVATDGGKWSFAITPGNSTQTGASRSASGTRSFSGSANENIGTIKVPVASTLRWSCPGCAGGVGFSLQNDLTDKWQLFVNGAATGATALNPGTYNDVIGIGVGPWTLTITPGDSTPTPPSSASRQVFSGAGNETLGTVKVPVASTLTWSCPACSTGFSLWSNATSGSAMFNISTTGGTTGTMIVTPGTYSDSQVQVFGTPHWTVTITPGFTARTP